MPLGDTENLGVFSCPLPPPLTPLNPDTVPHSLQVGAYTVSGKNPTDHVKSVSGGRIQAFRITNNFFYRVWVYTKSTKKELDRSIKYFPKSITLKLEFFRESGANSDLQRDSPYGSIFVKY